MQWPRCKRLLSLWLNHCDDRSRRPFSPKGHGELTLTDTGAGVQSPSNPRRIPVQSPSYGWFVNPHVLGQHSVSGVVKSCKLIVVSVCVCGCCSRVVASGGGFWSLRSR